MMTSYCIGKASCFTETTEDADTIFYIGRYLMSRVVLEGLSDSL